MVQFSPTEENPVANEIVYISFLKLSLAFFFLKYI